MRRAWTFGLAMAVLVAGADVNAGPRPSSPRDFAVHGDELFFNAGRPREGYELWKLPLAALEP